MRATDAAGNLGGYSNVATAVTTSTPPPTGLVAAYALNEGAGTTITDASGNGNSGTISGGFAWSSAGRWGGALSFNGVNSLVRVASSASLAHNVVDHIAGCEDLPFRFSQGLQAQLTDIPAHKGGRHPAALHACREWDRWQLHVLVFEVHQVI